MFAGKCFESYGAVLLEAVVHREIDDVLSVKDGRKFEVHCNAGASGELHVGTESLSVKIAQRVRRDGSEEMWYSVLIHCEESDDGSLTVKVIVCHFDWTSLARLRQSNRNRIIRMRLER